MPKSETKTPGTALSTLMERHGLSSNRLSKAIGLSAALVRFIELDQSPITPKTAYRLAQFFKTKPEYWLTFQMNRDIAIPAQDKAFMKEISQITTVDKLPPEPPKKRGTAKKTDKTPAAKSAKSSKPKTAKPRAAKPKADKS